MRRVTALLVLAKAPVPGFVKTRLCPPCSPEQAAAIAAAALADTLDAVRSTPCQRRVLVLDGDPSLAPHDGFEVLPQAAGGLGDRLDAAFAAVSGPAVLIAMDTPQIAPAELTAAIDALRDHDAVIGPATDGGTG